MEFVYALINFSLLMAIVYLIGGKTIKSIFQGRKEKINNDLDELERPLPVFEEVVEEESVSSLTDMAVAEEKKLRRSQLNAIKHQLDKDKYNLRREMLLKTRTDLVDKTMEKAEEIMMTEKFQNKLDSQESMVADKIINLIKLTPGDTAYLTRKKVLYVSLISPKPLKQETIDKMEQAAGKLISDVGGKMSFRVVDNEDGLLGGFRLRIGDTVYDYSVLGRLYRLRESLNNMPLHETDADSMYESISKAISEVKIDIDVFQVGRVLSVGDGICWLDGLSDIMYGELVEFIGAKRPMYGMVMDVQPERIGCIIFGKFEHIESYSKVRRLGKMASTPVGESLLGRVVDPLGNPIDGKGRIWESEIRPIEYPAPAIPDRQPVNVPMETGLKAIDAMVPIGRGQRELIIGDRQTGKSSIIIDTIINQKNKNIYCIYVAVGQKETTVASMVDKLETYGAMDYTTIVCSSASDSASMQYIAPFVGCAMAEYFMYKGKDVLIIYDDLSKHAVAYRELSLLLHRPSGREAYPGDIFYLHSRLLERAARLTDELGGGSITALPVIETLAGDISAYIPTNVISITDGQIFLEADLFNAGQRPAVNVGLSVSRVGGAAQSKLMKQVSSNLRTTLAQYREYAAFTQFGSEIDESTKKTLDSGERMMAILRQPRYEPMPTWQQALVIYAVSNGASVNYEVEKMNLFEKEFLGFFRVKYPELCNVLMTGDKMTREVSDQVLSAIDEFKKVS